MNGTRPASPRARAGVGADGNCFKSDKMLIFLRLRLFATLDTLNCFLFTSLILSVRHNDDGVQLLSCLTFLNLVESWKHDRINIFGNLKDN